MSDYYKFAADLFNLAETVLERQRKLEAAMLEKHASWYQYCWTIWTEVLL